MIERVLAPNPGLFTGPGTNTYLLASSDEVLILDPGPDMDEHRTAIIDGVGGRLVVGVIATHTHPDHAPLANPLGVHYDVPVLGFGPGPRFTPDMTLADGSEVGFGVDRLLAVHTPGHTDDHLCFRWGGTLFTGDHIMGGSTVVIEDATAYLESLYRVSDLGVGRLEPGHGDAMDDAGRAIDDYIEHRLEREREIVEAIGSGAATVGDVVDAVYTEVPSGLRQAAVHQVRVQLTKLLRDALVTFEDDNTEHSSVRLR